ncbi:MAG: UV DNA damage repair endonuclease UvsE [Thermomicrobiales bacterium]
MTAIQPPPASRRLGFAVKVLGQSGSKDHDSRRWQSSPHLRVSVGYLEQIFAYLSEQQIRMYRMSSNVVPYATHPDLPQFHRQIEESEELLQSLGADARRRDLRLSMHPAQYIVLNSPDEQIAEAAVREFVSHAALLDAMELPEEAKIVTHVGGVYGDREAAAERFARRYERLPEAARRRLVLENDETSWPIGDVLRIHAATGIPIVFDNLHHAVNNPTAIPLQDALRSCLATWPTGQVPKIHCSSQRREARTIARRGHEAAERTTTEAAAKPGQHDDWIDPEAFIALVSPRGDQRFDIMLEAKKKDLALLALRKELQRRGQSRLAW